jgi:hypothetical protein
MLVPLQIKTFLRSYILECIFNDIETRMPTYIHIEILICINYIIHGTIKKLNQGEILLQNII